MKRRVWHGTRAGAAGAVAGVIVAVAAGVVIAHDSGVAEDPLQLHPPKGMCVTGVDITYLEGQVFEVAAVTPKGIIAELTVVDGATALDVRTVGDSKVVDIYTDGSKTGAVLVENMGNSSDPAWVPVQIGQVTECGLKGDPPLVSDLLS